VSVELLVQSLLPYVRVALGVQLPLRQAMGLLFSHRWPKISS
jgi:hypothetical protein